MMLIYVSFRMEESSEQVVLRILGELSVARLFFRSIFMEVQVAVHYILLIAAYITGSVGRLVEYGFLLVGPHLYLTLALIEDRFPCCFIGAEWYG